MPVQAPRQDPDALHLRPARDPREGALFRRSPAPQKTATQLRTPAPLPHTLRLPTPAKPNPKHHAAVPPPIQIFQLGALVRRVDADLADHLQREGVDYVQFAFRWVNCLLQREMPLALSLRLWDTYLARATSPRGEGRPGLTDALGGERDGSAADESSLSVRPSVQAEGETFADFLTYVLAAFLLSWSDRLKARGASSSVAPPLPLLREQRPDAAPRRVSVDLPPPAEAGVPGTGDVPPEPADSPLERVRGAAGRRRARGNDASPVFASTVG